MVNPFMVLSTFLEGRKQGACLSFTLSPELGIRKHVEIEAERCGFKSSFYHLLLNDLEQVSLLPIVSIFI